MILAEDLSPLEQLRERLRSGSLTTAEAAAQAHASADASAALKEADCGTYVWRDPEASIGYAETLPRSFPEADTRPPLYGVPVSIKDCFDLAGTTTGCGSKFYGASNAPATENAWIVDRLLDAGAVISGKTHLHQLAYGITGENEDYGNCLQPRDRSLLTGGSSSGAVASVQEGSALVAVGTDTGGSVRVPAALCGLAGYRASHGLFPEEICWKGGAHLAVSFDTLGLLFQDLRDAALLGHAVFGLDPVPAPVAPKVGFVGEEFLTDCEPDVIAAYTAWKLRLSQQGATLQPFDTGFWSDTMEIFTPLQASEAAALHRGHFDHFEKAIAERLAWGASITSPEQTVLRQRHALFCADMDALFGRFEFIILPCAPISRLVAGEDQSGARARILRYTSPISLAGLPTVTLPGEALGDHFGSGVQLAAQKGRDADLLAFAAAVSVST
jgi:Asp-tRNA(Asn)/Glu-tRNA(Gln) amidotransferase A subunit family amidase